MGSLLSEDENDLNRIFAENAPKILKKIRQNMKVRAFLNKTKPI